jgi:hypothetical protein
MPAPSEPISILQGSLTELCVTLVCVIVISVGALAYFRRVRMDRPPIGTFNGRDIAILVVFICSLPYLYGYLPYWLITCVLGITFASALYLGYGHVIGRTAIWLGIGILFGLNWYTSKHLMGTTYGWQAYWLELDVMVSLGAIGVSNLYVQGGMKLKHIAVLATCLSLYDLVFTALLPFTDKLVSGYLSRPLDPLFGFRVGIDNYGVGLGDLLVYSLFLIGCYKAYGWKAARVAAVLIVLIGAVITSFAPFGVNILDPELDFLVPTQVLFGPAVVVSYLIMRRVWGPERTMAQFLASPDNLAGRTAQVGEPLLVREPISA